MHIYAHFFPDQQQFSNLTQPKLGEGSTSQLGRNLPPSQKVHEGSLEVKVRAGGWESGHLSVNAASERSRLPSQSTLRASWDRRGHTCAAPRRAEGGRTPRPHLPVCFALVYRNLFSHRNRTLECCRKAPLGFWSQRFQSERGQRGRPFPEGVRGGKKNRDLDAERRRRSFCS